MKEIALHLLDIVQNSVRAGATEVDISFALASDGVLEMQVRDDGCGMSPEFVEQVSNPFVTTRTTRKIGLGIPLLMQNTTLSGGSVKIDSKQGAGTTITAYWHTDSIDCLPLGDLGSTMATLIMGNPDAPEFTLTCRSDGGEMNFSTVEVRQALEGVSLAEPEVIQWIQDSIHEELEPILGGIMR